MPEGGALTITSRQEEAGVHFEVMDTGRGMSAEVQARIFEPLFTDGKSNGTGLGMMIVKEILDAHQARIDIDSEIGRGTTIHIFLPQPSSAV
jgi:signal transduction histidine kinase